MARGRERIVPFNILFKKHANVALRRIVEPIRDLAQYREIIFGSPLRRKEGDHRLQR